MGAHEFDAFVDDTFLPALERMNDDQLTKVWLWAQAEQQERAINPRTVIPMPTLPLEGIPEIAA